MTASPDPVTQGAAYQRLLLDLLGSDDPVTVQQSTAGRIEAMLDEAGPDLRRRPAPREWSVMELLGHLVDAEIVMSGRYRWVLSHDQPPLLGYDQDLWVDRLRHNEDDVSELLPLFVALRAANIRLWQRSPAPDRSRVAIHSERGPESFDLMFRMLAGHDRFHVNQMQATLGQLRDAN